MMSQHDLNISSFYIKCESEDIGRKFSKYMSIAMNEQEQTEVKEYIAEKNEENPAAQLKNLA